MGLFGFGKKNKENDNNQVLAEDVQGRDEAALTAAAVQGENSGRQEGTDDEAAMQKMYHPGDVFFEILNVLPNKEQGAKLMGKLIAGELEPGQKVSYLDEEGKRVFDCTVDVIEQNGHPLKKATSCCFGMLGPLYSFTVSIAPSAFQKGNHLYMAPEEGREISPVQAAFEACRLSAQEEEAVQEKLEVRELADSDINSLSIQETVYALTYARERENVCTEEKQKEGWREKGKRLYPALLDKIKTADSVYVTFDKATGFPFWNNGMVDVYSKKEFAELAVLYYREFFRELEVQEMRVLPVPMPGNVPPADMDKRIPAFSMFYYLGMERVMIDDGFYRALIGRGDILPPPDYSNIPAQQVPVTNPVLRSRMLDFFGEARWKVNYEKRGEILKAKENAMLGALADAKLLVPMRYEGVAGDPQKTSPVFEKGAKLTFAAIRNVDGESFTPVFTDFAEFGKLYPAKEWGAMAVSIQDAISLNKASGITVNPVGENLVLKEKAIEAIKSIIEKKKAAEESADAQPMGEA